MLKNLFVRVGVVVTGLAASVGVCYADAVDTAITGLGTTATSYVADALGVALVVAGGFWGISLMKKAMAASK